MADEQEISEGQRKFWFFLSIMMIIAGIGFYWVWGMMFGTWNLFVSEHLGAYTITILLVGFGVVGALLMRKRATQK